MKRLGWIDRALVAILVPLWAVCFTLSLRSALRPAGYSPLSVSAPDEAGGYPTVRGFLPSGGDPQSALRVGDRLIQLADVDLRGVGSVEFFIRFAALADHAQRIPVTFERGGVREQTTLQAGSTAGFVALPVASAVCVFVAVLLLLRGGPAPMVRAFFHIFMCMGFVLSATFLGSPVVTCASLAVHGLSMTLVGPLSLRALLLFPHGMPPTSRWARFGPWAFAVLGPLHMSRFGFPPPAEIGIPSVLMGVALFLVTTLVLTTRAYRRADPIGRRRIKWFLFGLYCGVAPPLATAALVSIDPRFFMVYSISLSALACIPLALLISVARYNLFDIDRLITSAASYNIVVVLAVAAGLLLVPTAAAGASALIGLDPWIGRIVVCVLLAGVVVPAQRRLSPMIERQFFAERYALDQGVEHLLRELSGCRDPQALTQQLGNTLNRLLRPEACVIYGRSDTLYAPLFAVGGPVPPGLEADGPIITTVRQHRGPLAIEHLTRGEREHAVNALQRAVLDSLAATVVVPIGRDELPALVLCLGAKRSGDIYTPTDLRLLSLVADRAALELLRFDQAEIIRQSGIMRETLRRYVPRVVAERLESGQRSEAGEYEVSVLFVDLRGFTAYSETLPAEQVFAVVNRYTESMSQLIREQGGSLVEFLGDGLMAVFGVPHPLAAKERAAIEAARGMISAIGRIPGAGGGAAQLTIGVGIATGRAFVGDIRSSDRLIWTAIGDTPNLAARLQDLSRELGAAIVIDSRTRGAAGAAAADFRKQTAVQIRGRRQVEDIYVLSLRPHADAQRAPSAGADHRTAP